jgi:hypothetical protein
MKTVKRCFYLAMLAAISLVISSCGNGGVPSVSSGSSTTRVAGIVTDAPASGATVRMYSMKTGAQVGSDATTLADGTFSIDADFSQYDADDVFYTVAEGGQVNGADADFLKFKSILGSQSELETAGADGTVNTTDIPDLAVSNVTSAKVLLVEKKRGITVDAGQNLAAAITNIATDKREQETENMGLVLKVAGAIKALVDDPNGASALAGTTLNQTTDIMTYMSNYVSVTNGVADVALPAAVDTAGAAQEAAILADANLSAGLTGEAAEAITAATVAGSWYGYSVNTWGPAEEMRGPQLHNMTVAATGGNCTSSQLYLTLQEDGQNDTVNVCADLSGNVITFTLTNTESDGSTFTDDIVGTIDGNNMDGTFTTKVGGKAVAGGIFKFGMADASTLAGTYSFTGEHTVLFVQQGITHTAVGETGTIQGSFTVSGTTVQGTITEQNSAGQDILMGELDGPRVKARLTTLDQAGNPANTIFMVFLLNDYEVTGLYMEFAGQLTDPTGDPTDAGKFKLSNVTKS